RKYDARGSVAPERATAAAPPRATTTTAASTTRRRRRPAAPASGSGTRESVRAPNAAQPSTEAARTPPETRGSVAFVSANLLYDPSQTASAAAGTIAASAASGRRVAGLSRVLRARPTPS